MSGDIARVVNESIPCSALEAGKIAAAIALIVSRSGNRSSLVLPRLNSVTVWPRRNASRTMYGPMKPVPPRTRMDFGPDLPAAAAEPDDCANAPLAIAALPSRLPLMNWRRLLAVKTPHIYRYRAVIFFSSAAPGCRDSSGSWQSGVLVLPITSCISLRKLSIYRSPVVISPALTRSRR